MAQHVEEDDLDQYAAGTLAAERLPEFEEHLLICGACQERLKSADEFARFFRVAAPEREARARRPWRVLLPRPLILWPAAAAMAASLLVVVSLRDRPAVAPATVFLQSLRGPDKSAQIAAGKPAVLVFDSSPAADEECEVTIVDSLGTEILKPTTSERDGRVAVSLGKLSKGSYWVRLKRKDSGQLIAEYGLEVR